MKAEKCLITLLFVVLLSMSNSYAQNESPLHRMGFRIGLGMSSITGLDGAENKGLPNVKYNIKEFRARPKFSWDVGYSYQYTNRNDFFVQSAIVFVNDVGASIKGVSKEYKDDITSINIMSSFLEIYVGRKLTLKEDRKFVFGIGPYIAYQYAGGYGGSSRLVYADVCDADGYCGQASYFVEGEEPGHHTFGVGVNFMVGFEFGNNQFSLVVTQGLTQVFKDPDFNSKMRTLKLSYTLYFINSE